MRPIFLFALLGFIWLIPASAPASDYRPDPAAVERYGAAYRFPQDGWIVLHIEGEPYERGYQHGKLLSGEIAAHLRCFAAVQGSSSPTEALQATRRLTNALFLRRIAPEYLEEMKGIADGASEAGARIHDRPVDLLDIVTINCWPEIETLDSGLEALPTGLEGKLFKHAAPRAMPKPRPEHCSAFAATGPATADGKIVFGHITMFSLYPSNFYNVWLDIKPAKGHRMLMCGYPGAIQSGMDYYLNDAGLLIAETTISQTRFNAQGESETSRIREAIQYAGTIDEAVAILRRENNGLYTNEWLLADINTNEIALFELGTRASKLHRSSKKEWIGGTEGFYWGCNNTKDMELRLETIASVAGRPANLVFHPSERDLAWQRIYQKYKGKIGIDFAKDAFTSPPIAAYPSLDAKFTTTELAKQLKSWALFGPPRGYTWQPTFEQRKMYPEIKPLVSNPWTILHGNAPTGDKMLAVDIRSAKPSQEAKNTTPLLRPPAWHGTILPQSDADIWLASAFADYERIVARQKALRKDGKELTPKDRDKIALELFAYRSRYLEATNDYPVGLVDLKSNIAHDDWYRIASGKGVLVLHELHRLLGSPHFEDMMDAFGREHAGKRVTTAQFDAHVKKFAGAKADGFIDAWVKASGLPKVTLQPHTVAQATSVANGHDGATAAFVVHGEILKNDSQPVVASVDITVEADHGEITKTIELKGPRTEYTIESPNGRPTNVILNKYGQTLMAGMRAYSVTSFLRAQEHTLIVYGTSGEVPTNREAAEALQKAIRASFANFTVPIKTDKEVTPEEIKSNHLLLIGRPDTNILIERWASKLPIQFGPRSFVVRGKTYAHPDSAVVVAAKNPEARRLSVVVIAGLSAAATLDTAPRFVERGQRAAEVLVFARGGTPEALVLP